VFEDHIWVAHYVIVVDVGNVRGIVFHVVAPSV